MYRLIPLCLFLLVLPTVEAVQEKPDAAPEVKAYPTLAPGHHVGEITAMVFTPDGKRLITGGEDKTIQVWDVASGKRVKLFRPPVGPVRVGQILSLALAPDGKTLAVGAVPIPGPAKSFSNALYLLNLEDGRMQDLYPFSVGAISTTFSNDGRQLAAALGTRLVYFDDLSDPWGEKPLNLKAVRVLGKCPSYVTLRHSPSGEQLLVAHTRQGPGEAGAVWDVKTGKKQGVALPQAKSLSAAWTLPGDQLVTGHTGGPALLRLWSAQGGEPIRTWSATEVLGIETGTPVNVHHISAVSKTTLMLLCSGRGESQVVRFDLATGKGRVHAKLAADRNLDEFAGAVGPGGIVAATAAPQGQRVAIFSMEEPGVRYLSGPAEFNQAAGWTATGNSVTRERQHKDGWIRSGLHLRTLEMIPVLNEPIVSTIHQREDVRLKLKRMVGEVGLEVSHGETRSLIKGVSLSDPYTLPAAGSPDWVAVAGYSGLQLYDSKTAALLRTFQPVREIVRSVASSPDGNYLFAVSSRGRMSVYYPAEVKPLLNIYTEDADWVAWTDEGYYAASPNGERLIGWTVNQGLNREANLLTAEQFRNTLYRPDVIKLLLDKGSVAEALKAANAVRKDVPKGAADPEKLLPPEVSLKLDTTKLPKAVVAVTAKAGCKEQPIKSLRLLVDGRPLPGGVGRVSYDVEKAEVTETWTVEIPPGKHRLTVLARSKDDTPAISSAVLVDSPLPANQRPVVHHVAIGISKYADDKLKLKFAEKDALDLASAIQKSCTGTLYQKVETTSLTNEKAKRDAVLDALNATRKVAKSTDLLILSFAGHGIRDDGEFYLLTHEADTTQLAKTAISGADLRAKLADYPCQILLMLDACHSGAFAPLAKFKPATDDAARALADVEMRVAVMCAAQGHEEAFEAKDNGHFTAAVVRALQRDPKAFFDLDTGELSVYHLQAFVSQEVSKATEFKQNPYLKMPLAHPPVIVTKFPKP